VGGLADRLLLQPPAEFEPPVITDGRGVESDAAFEHGHPHLVADCGQAPHPFDVQRRNPVEHRWF